MSLKINKHKTGFTLIELSLVIAFISVLLLSIATLTRGIIAIYRKGVAINSVNAVGRSIIDDITSSINSASGTTVEHLCSGFGKGTAPYASCTDDEAKKFIYNERRDGDGKPTYGVFCTGKYSYIWNTGYTLGEDETGSKVAVKYSTTTGGSGSKSSFKLLKILDTDRFACKQFVDSDYNSSSPSVLDFESEGYVVNEEPVDLIASTDNTLAVYHMYIESVKSLENSKRELYSGSFVLSTLRGDVITTRSGDYCSVNSGDFDYCAINKFNFVAQAIGGE